MFEDKLSIFTKKRSIRSYKNTPVEYDKIEFLLKAAMAAPSACNTQPWEIIVITESEVLDEIRNKLPMARYNAPCAIATMLEKNGIQVVGVGGSGKVPANENELICLETDCNKEFV